MSAPSFSWVNAPVLINADNIRDSKLPNQHLLEATIFLADDNATQPVIVHQYNPSPPQIDEFVSFTGSISHDGTKDGKLIIYATAIETFPWADINGTCSFRQSSHADLTQTLITCTKSPATGTQ